MECQNNQYEEQLYSVFKSFDVNNEEALDETAVYQLCDALQLEERGAALVDTLFEKKSGRVTFSQFRSGLLAVLGDRVESEAPPHAVVPPSHSDDDSSGREVAPRFVYGSKKYGRRSRPQSGETGEGPPPPRALSASRVDTSPPPQRHRPRRSASAMESRAGDAAAPEHDARVDRDEALALCRDLRMDAIDRSLVDRVFDEARAVDTTVGDFFERLNATLATTVEETRTGEGCAGPVLPEPNRDDDAILPIEIVIEAWESGGVRRPRRLLAELGFTGASLRVDDLERALDEETGAGPAPDALTAAALSLARLRASRASARAAHLAAERDRLRAAVAEADRRARLLAQEVDESHARLEAELRATLRRADARHADEARRVAREAAAEAERAAAERARSAAELARRDEIEARLRADLNEAKARGDRAEALAARAEEVRAGVARDRDRLAEALRAAELRADGAAAAAAGAAKLEARLEETARENARLRERVEELAAEIAAPRADPAPPPPAGSLSAELRVAAAASSAVAADLPPSVGVVDVDGDPELDDEDDEKRKLIELVKELEASLEAMRGEYEACEEYWSGKVAAERAAHEAETGAADARLAELSARVAEFERRLRPARAPALPPIAEQAALEAQVAALEAELAAARRGGRRCSRCARTAARAEAALRRLSARLAAADLLVKDLYMENCELARRRVVP